MIVASLEFERIFVPALRNLKRPSEDYIYDEHQPAAPSAVRLLAALLTLVFLGGFEGRRETPRHHLPGAAHG